MVTPNHLHLIILIEPKERAIHESPVRGKRSEISKIVGYLKMNVSKQIHEADNHIEFWQRGYYDHIIRSYDEYLKIAKYIQENPQKWEDDCLYEHDN